MSMLAAVPSVGSGFGFGSGFPSAAVPIISSPEREETTEETVTTLNKAQSYFVALAAINFIGKDAVQRIIYNKSVRDLQEEAGVPLFGRVISSLLVTTPVFIEYQTVTSNNAKNRRIQMCSPLLDAGEGIENYRMYYYDKLKDKCTKFHYKGSKGNDNRFSTKERCELVCRPFTEEGQGALQSMITEARKVDIFEFLAETVLGDIVSTIYAILLANKVQMDMPPPF